MSDEPMAGLMNGAACQVVGGTHAGKSGLVRDIKTSKTGHITITVVQADGERFKTLAKNVVVQDKAGALADAVTLTLDIRGTAAPLRALGRA